MDDENTHERLMQLFKEYFVANQAWSRQNTHVSGVKARHALAEIRILARKRRAEIQDIRLKKPKNTTQGYLNSNRRKAELKKTKQVDVVVSPKSTDNGTS